MKSILLLALSIIGTAALAAPTLTSDPYPAGSTQPASASLSINGGVASPCQLNKTDKGVQPACDLASITAPGTYQLVLTVSNQASIVNTDGSGTYTTGGEASAPFTYVLKAGLAGAPARVMLAP